MKQKYIDLIIKKRNSVKLLKTHNNVKYRRKWIWLSRRILKFNLWISIYCCFNSSVISIAHLIFKVLKPWFSYLSLKSFWHVYPLRLKSYLMQQIPRFILHAWRLLSKQSGKSFENILLWIFGMNLNLKTSFNKKYLNLPFWK